MIIEYVNAADDTVLDTVTFDGDDITYDTGRARSLVESKIAALGGADTARKALRSWSNGYVLTRVKK
jgi:hypothetical protein